MLRRLLNRVDMHLRLHYRLREVQGEVLVLLKDRQDLKVYLARTLQRTMTDFPSAEWGVSPYFTGGHNGLKPDFVVISTADAATIEEAIGDEPISYHYIVLPDGEMIQQVSEEHSAMNCGLASDCDPWWAFVNTKMNVDAICFSILLLTPDGAPSPAQVAHTCVLVKDLCTRHRIQETMGNQFGGIVPGSSINPRLSAKNFPFSALIDYLASGELNYAPASNSQEELKEDGENLSKPADSEDSEVEADASEAKETPSAKKRRGKVANEQRSVD